MKKTVLVFGGSSDERMVSVASAQNIAASLKFDKLCFLSKEGKISYLNEEELAKHKNPFQVPFQPVQYAAEKFTDIIAHLKEHIVFLGLHGTEGEDGKIQSLLEDSQICFTGSGSQSSRNCFDKTSAKKLVVKHAVEIAPEIILSCEGDTSIEKKLTEFYELHKKVVVKPVANGSSIGLIIVLDAASLKKAIQHIWLTKTGIYMAEKFIEGRELTVGVIERAGKILALPPSEIIVNPGNTFDYDEKYLGLGTREITPAQLSVEECDRAQDAALKAHKILNCYGYSRTDLIFSDNCMVYLETNSLPGLTSASFIPQQLLCEGISMRTFIQEQIALAAKRYGR